MRAPIKLYTNSNTTHGKIVSMVLYEKGIPFEFVNVDFASRQQKTPEFLEMNPFGMVPCIDDNGLVLCESRAIARYLEENYPGGPGLIPFDPRQRALYDQAAAIEISRFDQSGMPLVFEVYVKPLLKLEANPAKRKELENHMNATLDVYDKILAKQRYIAGDTFTLADLFHIPTSNILARGGFDIGYKRPHVRRWFEEISSRPSWQQAQTEVIG